MVVILVVLTEREFRFSLLISQLLAKAIPVRGAKFRKSRLRKLKRDFCFYHFIQCLHVQKYFRYTFRLYPALGEGGGQIGGQVGSIIV
ncbi:hypothetical protein EH204_07065 [Pectobacterium carotovorum subsp. carotovorum]|nr:hypothetical protein EH204_07065 [Pectobacterium carotovorum subsp. carotovorum]